jgi:hypothetical protein
MISFVYQYAIMWVVFSLGCGIGVRSGELGFSGRGGRRLAVLVVGMLGYMALQAAFTDWSAP